MIKLLDLLKQYTLKDALDLEKQDPQYKALEKLFLDLKDKELFFWLILANSIVCYQLSSSWESYWEEFTEKAWKWHFKNDIISFLKDFLPKSKWNKRLLEIKIKRLEKLKVFLDLFTLKVDYYIDNLLILRDDLSKVMNQRKDAKTIVFAIKMIMYWIRIIGIEKEWHDICKINIPIDSRLTNIFEKYKDDYVDIRKFYFDLSEKLDIPEIHLDAILWCNYKKLVE